MLMSAFEGTTKYLSLQVRGTQFHDHSGVRFERVQHCWQEILRHMKVELALGAFVHHSHQIPSPDQMSWWGVKPFQNRTAILEIWCYRSVEWKKTLWDHLQRSRHFQSARKIVEAMMLLFLETGWFLKAEGGLWNLKFLMHLSSCDECRFEIIFGPATYFNLTFKHKLPSHAKANFCDTSAPKIYKTATLSGFLS